MVENATFTHFLIFLLVSLVSAVVVSIIVDRFVGYISDSIDKKHHKQYPRYFELRDEYNRISNYNRMYYNTFVEPVKEEIDYLLDNMKYLTEEAKREKEKIIEENRKELSIYLAEDEKSKREMEELRKALQAYVEENGIEKWAGAWTRL